MVGWCTQLSVISIVLLSARPADAYQLDQFYSFNATRDQQVIVSVSSPVALNATFPFINKNDSYISVSHFCTSNVFILSSCTPN